MSNASSGARAPFSYRSLVPYGASLLATAVSTLIAWALASWIALDSLVMVYLVGVVVIAARYGRGPSILAAVASSLAFDFFFTRPFLSLRIADPRLVMTVAVMLLVGLVISQLTAALRDRSRTAIERTRRMSALYSLTRDLARATDEAQIVQAAQRHVARLVAGEAAIVRHGAVDESALREAAMRYYPEVETIVLPLLAAGGSLGVMIVRPRAPGARLQARQARLLGNCAKQVAGALERERLVRAAHASDRAAQAEQLRNSLLASVSHDLRQPLMLIESAATSLLHGPAVPGDAEYAERVTLLVTEARQMSDTVNKILDMTRLESTPVQLERLWYPIESIVVGALDRVRGALAQHVVVTDIPEKPIWTHVDVLVFEKLLTNLLENAAKYSPPGSTVRISAASVGNALEIRVSDAGCGLPPGDSDAVFQKFRRGNQHGAIPGIGLGLAICRAIVELHGGTISAHRRATGGTEFLVQLPMPPGAPEEMEWALAASIASANAPKTPACAPSRGATT